MSLGRNLIPHSSTPLYSKFRLVALQRALRASPASKHVLVASCDPGIVVTNIFDKDKVQATMFMSFLRCCGLSLLGKSPEKGAEPVVNCATSPHVADHGGAMWAEGPVMRLYPLPAAYFTRENSDAAFAAINVAIKSTGRPALG